MSILGSYEVHKSNYDCNPVVLNLIALAKLTKNPRDYIDCLSGGKATKDIRQDKETKRVEGLDREDER